MFKIFKEKTLEEVKIKGIKKLEKTYKMTDMTDLEKECLYYASLNYNSRKELDKNTFESLKHLAKMMAQEHITEQEVLVAQNFVIIDLLSAIYKSVEKK